LRLGHQENCLAARTEAALRVGLAQALGAKRIIAMPNKSKMSYALPAVIYVVLIGTIFSPDVQPVLTKAFGPELLGFPVAWVVAAAQAILLFPFIFAIHHFMLIAEQAAADGHSIGKIGLLMYLASVGKLHPRLRWSQIIAAGGLVYFVLVCGLWIAYADAKGI
jgi:hypothetical protein